MIHTKNINFSRFGEDFEVIVTWDDQPFKNLGPKATKAFWKAQLVAPRAIEIKEHRISARGFSRMGLSRRNDGFVLIEDEYAEWSNKNIYPWVVAEILYRYYNEDYHAYYRRKIEKIKSAIDSKYTKELKRLHLKKQELNAQVKSGELDTKSHQILIRPLFKQKYTIDAKVRDIKCWIDKRYFTCCKLKESLQYKPGKVKYQTSFNFIQERK